jgi:hypothetical protein
VDFIFTDCIRAQRITSLVLTNAVCLRNSEPVYYR